MIKKHTATCDCGLFPLFVCFTALHGETDFWGPSRLQVRWHLRALVRGCEVISAEVVVTSYICHFGTALIAETKKKKWDVKKFQCPKFKMYFYSHYIGHVVLPQSHLNSKSPKVTKILQSHQNGAKSPKCWVSKNWLLTVYNNCTCLLQVIDMI